MASATLTYETVPEGAVIQQGGKVLGTAPVVQIYPSGAQGGDIRTPEVTAVWLSGAKAVFWTNLKVGDDRVATLERPAKAPGLQRDLDNAKPYAEQKERDLAKAKEQALRDQAATSARCQEERSKGVMGTPSCF
jgi:hypothetical protein